MVKNYSTDAHRSPHDRASRLQSEWKTAWSPMLMQQQPRSRP